MKRIDKVKKKSLFELCLDVDKAISEGEVDPKGEQGKKLALVAAGVGWVDVIDKLIKGGFDITSNSNEILHKVLFNHELDSPYKSVAIKELARLGLDINQPNTAGEVPVITLLYAGECDMLQTLLEIGVVMPRLTIINPPNDVMGNTLGYIKCEELLETYCKKYGVRILYSDNCVSKHPPFDLTNPKKLEEAIMINNRWFEEQVSADKDCVFNIITRCDSVEVIQLLHKHGFLNVAALNNDGHGLLETLIIHTQRTLNLDAGIKIMSALIEHGASVNQSGKHVCIS